VNDAHDTNVDFTSDWLTSFLVPLLANPSFNDNRTVILLTFDESESYNLNNNVYTLALGGGLPKELIGTTDSTYYTHYSTLSTVQANWGLGSLGRGDTNRYVPFLPTSLMYLTSVTPGLSPTCSPGSRTLRDTRTTSSRPRLSTLSLSPTSLVPSPVLSVRPPISRLKHG
jgi:hypothetical protein